MIGFRLEMKYSSGRTVRELGGVLTGLMDKNSGFHVKTAKYYATRGKLTNLDALRGGAHTALTYTAKEGHLDIMEALLAAGADKDKGDSSGNTPLIRLMDASMDAVVKLLLAAGAKKDKTNSDGETAGKHANVFGYHEITFVCRRPLLLSSFHAYYILT